MELAATVTEAGTGSDVLLLVKATLLPPDGAALESVTVQVVLALAASEVGEHWRDESVTGARRVRVADWEEPLRVAVITAV